MLEQRSTVSPWTTTARSRFMSFHQARTSAWNDPSISSTTTRPSAQDPHAVEVAPPALLVEAHDLSVWRRQTRLGADLPDVDLGERLGATGDVAEDEPEGPAVAQLADQGDGRPEAVRRGEALLHAGGQQPDGSTYVAVTLRRQERGVLEGQPRRSADRLDPPLVRSARLVEEVAVERLHQVALRRQYVDDVASDPVQASRGGRPSGGTARRRVRRAGRRSTDAVARSARPCS